VFCLVDPIDCWLDDSFGMNVTIRGSTMFSAVIQLNCSSINRSDLLVAVDQHDEAKCSVDETNDKSCFDITCLSIDNSAGRDIRVDLSLGAHGNSLGRFHVTLTPLPLNESTSIEIEYTEDPQQIVVHVNDCQSICPEEYLRLQCLSSTSTESILKNCSVRCVALLPGSNSSASLIRLSIPLIDQPTTSFPAETVHHSYQTSNKSPVKMTCLETFCFCSSLDLSSASNLSFLEDNPIVRISYRPPLGFSDRLFFECIAQDRMCSNQSERLTANIASKFNSTEVFLTSVVHGVKYSCRVTTVRSGFVNVTSNEYFFHTGQFIPLIHADS
jgi:hypothetical protein